MKSLFFFCVVIIGASAFPQAENGCGVNERGVLRQPGDNWQEDCNRCRCLAAGVPGCTKKFCGGFPSLGKYLKVCLANSFLTSNPFLVEPKPKTCLDSLGNTRQEGEEWEESADM